MEYEFDELDEDEIAWREVRLRNLEINIAKQLINRALTDKSSFTNSELKDIFAFKESDILYLASSLFWEENEKYTVKEDFADFLDRVFKSHTAVLPYLETAEAEFIHIYGAFYDMSERDPYGRNGVEPYGEMYEKLKNIIPIIHWGRLPIFNRYLLYNRNVNPESDMLEFYDHPDCLTALLNDIKNKGIVLSNSSDASLNKKMSFDVYTRRWGHIDTYAVERTVDGWKCGHISINGKCKKDGEGSLFSNLEHDGVFFPKEGVAYAMQRLWEDADDGKIDFDELSERLQQVADWISTVEKSVNAQPEWVNYY